MPSRPVSTRSETAGEGRQVKTASTVSASARGESDQTAPAASKGLRRLRVDVVHPEAEAGAPEAGGERPAEIAQSDETVSHRRSRLPNHCLGE